MTKTIGKFIWCAFVLFGAFAGLSSAKKLPSFITPCKRNDPHLNECFTKAAESLRDRLKEGIPQMRVPAVDPLTIPRLDLTTGNGTALQINCVFRDVVVYGGSNFQNASMTADLEKGTFSFKVMFPNFRIKTNYDIKGRILVLSINGKGSSDGNFSNIEALHQFQGHFIKKSNNKQFWKMDSQNTHITIGKSTMYFGDLFRGREDLTSNVNRIINENANELVEEFKPLVEETVSSIISQVWNNVFEHFSIDDLFPVD